MALKHVVTNGYKIPFWEIRRLQSGRLIMLKPIEGVKTNHLFDMKASFWIRAGGEL